ncbi:TlyA family RNA methyltransferase [Bacillus carboniphilus]|uniref:TlyA family RNA methyltransferase n=1 Tax=Bacillus carboniphilus TaxID=86663 RepID=A0ABY9JZS3_9BACI|nr:TlyA family RNA methyltransferase [Bacillus carboniphilus]WLR44279.1 TlyA family RNA methyltransferase [Bacillus carboniphilus]
MMSKKERLDVLLVERGLMDSREKAKRSIMAGLIFSNEERLDKPGEKVSVDIPLTVKGAEHPYVSRGGLKLEKAIEVFGISFNGKLLVDIGSSTGGFTDCALQNGARGSYAVDVGYNQLAWKLRQDNRVVVMERTNFRYAKPLDFAEGLPDVASIDVSFISLKIILPVLKSILIQKGHVIALVKPQFEAGRDSVGKKGIVREKKTHVEVLNDITTFSSSIGFDCVNLTFSPITGGEGNIEFLLHLKWEGKEEGDIILPTSIDKVVTDAHLQLKKSREQE